MIDYNRHNNIITLLILIYYDNIVALNVALLRVARRKSLFPTREQDDYVTPPTPPPTPPRHAETETNEHAFATGSCLLHDMHGISRRPLTVQDSGGARQRLGLCPLKCAVTTYRNSSAAAVFVSEYCTSTATIILL